MPLKWFICPDNVRIEKDECLKEGGCRMGDRCATRSYLRLVARDRPWTGKPSTTQLIQGTLCAFLKITKEYATSPDARAFMINGTKGHANLEESPDEQSLLEQKFDGSDEVTGISDVLETENGETVLADYKVSGSFKVAKALGFWVDEEPTGELITRGKRKGEPKMRKVLKRSPEKEDRRDWELQLNKYRIEAQKKFPDMNINKLKIQCCVRDGNTYIARSRGIYRNIYYFRINILPDEEIIKYFADKKVDLLQALKQGYWNQICSREENWEGLKCERYCEVAEHCSYGKFLKIEKATEDAMIKGLSETRRFPRLGKIRLGMKKTKVYPDGKKTEYPVELDYFRLDPSVPVPEEREKILQEFERKYGKEPKSIDVMFPHPDPQVFFPQFFKRYGGNRLAKCIGDGETAECSSAENASGLKITGDSERGWKKVECNGQECPYYKAKQCSERGTLNVLLPELPGIGVWQIETGSIHGIIGINSAIEGITRMCGRVNMIPLKLERRPIETNHDGKKMTHYPIFLNQDIRLADLQRFALIDATRVALELPAPDPDKEDILTQENKEIDPEVGEIIDETGDELIDMAKRKTISDAVYAAGISKEQWIAWLTDKCRCASSIGIRSKYYNEVLRVIKEDPTQIINYKTQVAQ